MVQTTIGGVIPPTEHFPVAMTGLGEIMKKCSKPNDLQGMSEALEDKNKFVYWDEISQSIDELCLEIVNCPNRCDNETCKALHDSEEIELALAEERADRCIIDTLPDDEFY